MHLSDDSNLVRQVCATWDPPITCHCASLDTRAALLPLTGQQLVDLLRGVPEMRMHVFNSLSHPEMRKGSMVLLETSFLKATVQ